MLAAGKDGFMGGLTTRKYVSIARVSSSTAYREIEDMRQKGIVQQFGSGRSVHYELAADSR
jgi:Fic family protein